MEYVAPAAPYTSRLSLGPDFTGLVGTIREKMDTERSEPWT
jgi:hypothetical protein